MPDERLSKEEPAKCRSVLFADLPKPKPCPIPDDVLHGDGATWEAIVEVEPRIKGLADRVKAAGSNRRAVGKGLKAEAMHLVGFHADVPQLRSMDCYDVVFRRLFW